MIPSEKADPGIGWSVYVYEDNTADVVALPSGHLVVNSGLAKVAGTSDEIAAAIATPMSMVLLKHAEKRLGRQTDAQLRAIVAAAMATSTAHQAELARQEQETRDREVLEADELGRSLMKNAGFDPIAQLALWKTLLPKQPLAKANWSARIESSRVWNEDTPHGDYVSRNRCALLP